MSTQPPPQEQALSWQTEMPLLTSRFFLYDFAKVILITGAIFYLILLITFAASSGLEHIGQMTAVIVMILGGIAFLFAMISLVFFTNRWPMAYALSSRGLTWQSKSTRGRRANRVAMLVGVLAGKPGMVGAGLLATSEEQGWMSWQTIRRVKAYPEQRVISIRNSWRVVIRLFCNPDNFDTVLQTAEYYTGRMAEIAASGELPQTGRPPVAIFELLRRAALLGGICAAAWLALDSQRILVQVQRADFEQDYAREYSPTPPPSRLLKGDERPLIDRSQESTSLRQFIAESTENRLLASSDPQWAAVFASLPADGHWMSIDDPALASLRGSMADIYSRSQWISMYLPVNVSGSQRYLEFRYETDPRGSHAPSTLIYPRRSMAWLYCLGGLVIYAILPWAKRSAWMIAYDALCPVALDFLGVVIAGFFFALPLYASRSIDEALSGDFGLTLFLWAMALIGVLILFWSARCAATAILVEQGQMRIRHLSGASICSFAEIASAQALAPRGIWSAVRIATRAGKAYTFRFGPLCRFERLLDGLRYAGVPLQPPPG